MILHLQYLRGIAALMVVVFHVTDSAGRLGEIAVPHFAIGFAGVDLFFVISGFIIYVTTRSVSAARPLGFLKRRALRVVPLYWLLTGLMAATALFLPALMATSVFDPWHVAASFLFLPAEHPTFALYNPLLVVGWTLNYEMAFYALFALVLVLPARLHLAASLGAIASLALLGAVAQPAGALGFYTDPIILEFAAGLLIAHLHMRGRRIPLPLGLVLVVAGALGLLLANEETRAFSAGLPAALLVAGAVFAERASGPVVLPGLRLLGDASYSLYLVHLPVLAVFQIVYARLGLGEVLGVGVLYVALATLACLLAGIACYLLVERPVNTLLRPRAGKGVAPRPVVPAPLPR